MWIPELHSWVTLLTIISQVHSWSTQWVSWFILEQHTEWHMVGQI